MNYKKTVLYSDMTNHADIYSMCYWGNFENKYAANGMDTIYANRNQFIKDYKIALKQPTKRTGGKKIPEYVYKLSNFDDHCGNSSIYYDHLEYYKAEPNLENPSSDRWVIINSPYAPRDATLVADVQNKLQQDGWTQIYSLYHPLACTYVKIVEQQNKRKRKNQDINSLEINTNTKRVYN